MPREKVDRVVYAVEYGGDARREFLERLVHEHVEGRLSETLHGFVEGLVAATAEREKAG